LVSQQGAGSLPLKPGPRKASHVDGTANPCRTTVRMQQQPLTFLELSHRPQQSKHRRWAFRKGAFTGTEAVACGSQVPAAYGEQHPYVQARTPPSSSHAAHPCRTSSKVIHAALASFNRIGSTAGPLPPRSAQGAAAPPHSAKARSDHGHVLFGFPAGHGAPFIFIRGLSQPQRLSVAFHPSGSRGCVSCLSHRDPSWRMDGAIMTHDVCPLVLPRTGARRGGDWERAWRRAGPMKLARPTGTISRPGAAKSRGVVTRAPCLHLSFLLVAVPSRSPSSAVPPDNQTAMASTAEKRV